MARTGDSIQVDPENWSVVLDFIAACPNSEMVNVYGDDGQMQITMFVNGLVRYAENSDWIHRTEFGLEVEKYNGET